MRIGESSFIRVFSHYFSNDHLGCVLNNFVWCVPIIGCIIWFFRQLYQNLTSFYKILLSWNYVLKPYIFQLCWQWNLIVLYEASRGLVCKFILKFQTLQLMPLTLNVPTRDDRLIKITYEKKFSICGLMITLSLWKLWKGWKLN